MKRIVAALIASVVLVGTGTAFAAGGWQAVATSNGGNSQYGTSVILVKTVRGASALKLKVVGTDAVEVEGMVTCLRYSDGEFGIRDFGFTLPANVQDEQVKTGMTIRSIPLPVRWATCSVGIQGTMENSGSLRLTLFKRS
jgi:hypothetical protein